MSRHRTSRISARSRIKRAGAALRGAAVRLWRALNRRQQRFVSNAAVAVVVLVILGFLDESHWLLRLENSAIDTMMELNQGLGRMTAPEAPAFTWLDIDQQSFRAWGEPHHTPRDKLLTLIRFAQDAGALAIVVDIDLARPGTVAENDRALADYLSGLDPEDAVPVILVRSYYGNSDPATGYNELRPSFLDDYELSAAVHWAQPLFETTLWDGVIRHWHLARVGCLNGRPVLVPSVQLLAAALISENVDTVGIADIEGLETTGCLNAGRRDGERARFDVGLGQRLVFTIGWREPSPDLITIPGYAVTAADTSLSADLVEDRVVVIGASYAEASDMHRTPIGVMPGALVIVNAIKSLAVLGQLSKPALLVDLFVKLGVILVAAWAFSRFDSLFAVGIAACAIIVVLVPVSFYLFKYGVWIEFSIPVLAMVVHRGFAEYRAARTRLARDGT